jgi:AraC-like DNA-binding protein
MRRLEKAAGRITRRVSSNLATSMFFEVEVEGAHRTLAEFDRGDVGDLTFIAAHHAGGGFRAVRPDYLIDESECHDYFMTLVLSGTLTILQDGRRADVTRGNMCLIDSRRSYVVELGESGNVLWIRIPRTRLSTHFLSLEDGLGRIIDGDHGVAYVAARSLLATARTSNQLSDRDGAEMADQCVRLIIAALRAASTIPSAKASRNATQMLHRLEQLVEDHLFDEELDAGWLADRLHISIRYVSKLFRMKGVSPKAWINRRRLDHCRQVLIDPHEAGRSIKDIAYAHGFKNLPAFNRQFKIVYGCTPSSCRTLLVGDGPVNAKTAEDPAREPLNGAR